MDADVGIEIRTAIKNLNLVELIVRESIGGFQAIAKYAETRSGPWGVGCDEDPILAIEQALFKGSKELHRVRSTFDEQSRAECAHDYAVAPAGPKKRRSAEDML